VSIEEQAGKAPATDWMFWRKEISLVPARILTPDLPSHSSVNILAMLISLMSLIK
jgi:hypothetical protein